MSSFPTDKRAKICKMLQLFAKEHPEQQETADTMLQFICSTPDCFERSHAVGHITGSAWLVNPAGDRALLTLHHNLGRWMQTGGHADGDSNPLNVALREAEEESGICGIMALSDEIFDIDIHRIPERPAKGEPAHYHYDIRYLLQAPHERFSISPESDDLAWWSADDFAANRAILDEAVLRMSRRYFSAFRQH